jgi:AcrR family transcriptional regulator
MGGSCTSGLKGPVLFWYFKSKDGFLTAMSKHILQSVLLPGDEGAGWRNRLLAMVLQEQASAPRLCNGARLIATAQWETSSTSDLLKRYIRPLMQDGLPCERGLRLIASLNSFWIGWTLNEERVSHREPLKTVFAVDVVFSHAARSIVYVA